MDKRVIVVVVVVAIFVAAVTPFCFVSPPTDIMPRCEYEGWTFQDGSSFKAPNPYCATCSCHKGMLDCCGYGRFGGVGHIEGCKQVRRNDSCFNDFVRKDDESQSC